MKGKKFYFILIALIAVGIGSIFIYRQQQEARALEFEGYEISSIENRVEELYNDEKTDIKDNISMELSELEQILTELYEKDLSTRSENRIENMREQLFVAKEMYELQEDISDLFKEEEIVQTEISLKDLETLETSLQKFEDKTIYYKRNNNYITDARVQIETIEEATKLVKELLTDEESDKELNEEELEKIEELINQIKDESIKNRLMEQVESVRLALAEAEEETALDEAEDELEEDESEELPEEMVQEENIEEEVVQETNQVPEQSSTHTAQDTNRTQSNQKQTNNNQSQSTSDQSNSQSQKPSPPAKQPSAPSRPAVAEVKQEIKVEEIPYTTTRNTSSDLEEGTEVVFSEGSTGTKKITYEITVYTNGTSNKKVVSEEIVKDPSSRVIVVGTKPSSPVEEPATGNN